MLFRSLGVIRFRSGLIAHIFDAFTCRYTRTAFEVHGTEGSLFGDNCMTQRPIGTVMLRNAQGETALPLDQENLYERSVRAFHAAIRGEGAPSATGEDGVRSMATALAVLDAARSGHQTIVDPGL